MTFSLRRDLRQRRHHPDAARAGQSNVGLAMPSQGVRRQRLSYERGRNLSICGKSTSRPAPRPARPLPLRRRRPTLSACWRARGEQQDPEAFDAQPAAVVDAAGIVWLVWHSHRLGSQWQPSTGYTASSLLAPAAANGRRYRCSTPGTSGATAPTFPQTPGATVTDGTAVWTCIGSGIVRRRIWFQRLTIDATPVDATSDLLDNPSFVDEAPSALFDGTRVWIFWSSNRNGTTDIWGRSITGGNPAVLGSGGAAYRGWGERPKPQRSARCDGPVLGVLGIGSPRSDRHLGHHQH